MVRAGVVTHPKQWIHSGYHEIQKPKERYGMLAFKSLVRLLPIDTHDELKQLHRKWIEEELKKPQIIRQSKWAQSITVGDNSFVELIKERLGIRAKGRKIHATQDDYQLREGQTGDGADSENTFHWDLANYITDPHIFLKAPILPPKWQR
jgi:putative transposase